MKSILMTLSLLALTGCGACDDESASLHALNAYGFRDVAFHGHAYSGCSKNESSAMDFTAKNPNGDAVSGVVCCGVGLMAKGCTVRF
jgi:hypothetical protein